jgi:hypothetical protein
MVLRRPVELAGIPGNWHVPVGLLSGCAEGGLAPSTNGAGRIKLISGICDQGDWHCRKPTHYPDDAIAGSCASPPLPRLSLPERRALISLPGIAFAGARSSPPWPDPYRRGRTSARRHNRRLPANGDVSGAGLCRMWSAFWSSSNCSFPRVVTAV